MINLFGESNIWLQKFLAYFITHSIGMIVLLYFQGEFKKADKYRRCLIAITIAFFIALIITIIDSLYDIPYL